MYINEATTEYDPCLAGKKVHVRLGEKVYENKLKPSFKSKRMNVGIFDCIAKDGWTSLILVRKKSKKEHTSACDRLSLNASQFARNIHQPYVIPFICELYANPNHIYFAANETKYKKIGRRLIRTLLMN